MFVLMHSYFLCQNFRNKQNTLLEIMHFTRKKERKKRIKNPSNLGKPLLETHHLIFTNVQIIYCRIRI